MQENTLDYDFQGQVAAVTGASRGFGLLFAQELAKHGATVVLTDINDSLGTNKTQELRDNDLDAYFLHLDVRSAEHVHSVAQQIQEQHGSLDIWINNAGVAIHGPSEDMPAEKWQLGIDTMLSGVFFGCQSAGRIMLEQGQGTIINIASVNGFVAQAGRAAYCAAKAGVIRLTEVLAAEWAPHGVRVNAVAPAVFTTDLMKAAVQDGSASMEVYLNRSPTRRLGELPELANTILFLASDHSSYITGQTLRVDGAWVSDHYV